MLTSGDGKVTRVHVNSEEFKVIEAEEFCAEEFKDKQIFIDCILMNNDVTFQAEDPRTCKLVSGKKD